MRKRNWRKYNRQLIQRGSITFLIDSKLFETKDSQRFGRPRLFSDFLILMLMLTKIHYHLAYRSLQGFAQTVILLSRLSFSVPDYSVICRRARKIKLPKLSSKRPSVVAIDASGVKVYGEGEWKIKIHGKSKRRKWLKIHIAVDPLSGEIVAESTTESHIHDGKELGKLLNQTKGTKLILADGVYDGKKCREAIRARGARGLIPPPKNGRIRNLDSERDEALRIIRGFGGDKEARSLWGKLTGYSQRSLVETAFSRMKKLFGCRLFSKRFDAQKIENHLRCMLLNKMNRLTT